MVFYCETCRYLTDRKSNYEKHLNSGRHALKERIVAQPAIVNVPVNVPVNPPAIAVASYKCKFCEKCYHHKSSLSKHVNHTCTKNKVKTEINKLNERLEEHEKKIENQKTIIDIQTKQIQNLTSKIEIKQPVKVEVHISNGSN
jgi:hypothetical protein